MEFVRSVRIVPVLENLYAVFYEFTPNIKAFLHIMSRSIIKYMHPTPTPITNPSNNKVSHPPIS